jgi:hypothetical protein
MAVVWRLDSTRLLFPLILLSFLCACVRVPQNLQIERVIYSLFLIVNNMGVDRRGNPRGKCTLCDCDDFELSPGDDTNLCLFCGHHSPSHERMEINKETFFYIFQEKNKCFYSVIQVDTSFVVTC